MMEAEAPPMEEQQQQAYEEMEMGEDEVRSHRRRMWFCLLRTSTNFRLTVNPLFASRFFFVSFRYLQVVPHYQTLEVLQEHGIAANDIQKLQNAGYHTVESVSNGVDLLLLRGPR